MAHNNEREHRLRESARRNFVNYGVREARSPIPLKEMGTELQGLRWEQSYLVTQSEVDQDSGIVSFKNNH